MTITLLAANYSARSVRATINGYKWLGAGDQKVQNKTIWTLVASGWLLPFSAVSCEWCVNTLVQIRWPREFWVFYGFPMSLITTMERHPIDGHWFLTLSCDDHMSQSCLLGSTLEPMSQWFVTGILGFVFSERVQHLATLWLINHNHTFFLQ